MNRILTILILGIIITACSSSETKDRQKNNEGEEIKKTDGEKNLSSKDPEVLFAIIQESIDPPSEGMVQRFNELLNSIKMAYSNIEMNAIADKIALAYDMADKKGNQETLLEFVEGFKVGTENALHSNLSFNFDEYLANYVCYKTNCDSGNAEMLKLFGSDYTSPSRKPKYEGGDFVLIENIEIFKQRFNSFSKEATSSLRVRQVKIHDGNPNDPGNAFEYAFSNHLYVVGGLNKKDNSVRTLSIILESTDSPNDIGNFLVATLGAISSVNPELKPEERGQILTEIGLTDTQRIKSEESWNGKTIKNGTQFTIAFIYGQGFIFNAEGPND